MQRQLDELGRELTDEGREIASRGLATADRDGLTVEPHVVSRQGREWQAILSEADAIDADVIVCGSRGRGGIARSLLGSTSTGVLHHAERPVLVVPAPPAAVDGPALIAYDDSDGARAAIATAGRLLDGRPVVVANVWRSPVQHSLGGRAMAGAPVGELREFAADYEALFADALAIARILEPHVAEVVHAHDKDMRAMSHARVKADTGSRAPRLCACRPEPARVADLTEFSTWEGKLCLAVVVDAFSRRCVGWAMVEHMRAELVAKSWNWRFGTGAPTPVWFTTATGRSVRVADLGPDRPRRRHCRLVGAKGCA